ncbi:RCC1/BLIP-II, partial [Pilatotrama ljubarskyi]
TVVQIAGGDDHTLFLISDGRVFACGSNWSGQLGVAPEGDVRDAADPGPTAADATDPARPSDAAYRDIPTPKPVLFPHSLTADPIVHVACGPLMSAAVTRDGVLYTWGSNTNEQIGVRGVAKEVRTPTVVVRREGSWRAKRVTCGGQHCLGLLQRKEAA